jgi:hypothetical protein
LPQLRQCLRRFALSVRHLLQVKYIFRMNQLVNNALSSRIPPSTAIAMSVSVKRFIRQSPYAARVKLECKGFAKRDSRTKAYLTD